MADSVTKEKIISIKTQGAEKNVKSLKTQIRELKEQLAGLEQGTAEYDRVAKQLADTNQKQIEINEAMMYSNKDFGATLSNLTKVSAGVVGAISSINGVMTLMGADSEEAMEAMKNIQAMMAIVQGLGAIDTAVKALKGLTVAFGNLGTAEQTTATVALAAAENKLQSEQTQTTATTIAETAAIKANTAAKGENAITNGAMGKGIGNATKSTGGFLNVIKKVVGLVTKIPPIFLGIGAAIAAIGAGIAIWYAKAHEEQRKRLEMENEINSQYQQEYAEMAMLIKAFEDQNTRQDEKKVLAEEINKKAGEELVTRNKITGELELSNDKLKEYQENLRTTIELEYIRKRLLELMEKQKELENQKIHEQTHLVGKLFKTEKGLTKDINKNLEEQNKLIGESVVLTQKLAGHTAKVQENAKNTKANGIVKTLKEILNEIKEMYYQIVGTIFEEREFKKVYDGVYNQTDILFDRIVRIIRSKGLGDMISDEFAQAIADKKNPLIENYNVTIEKIFKDNKIKEYEEELIELEEKLANRITKNQKMSEEEIKTTQTRINELKELLTSMKAVAQAAQEYADYQDEITWKARDYNELMEAQNNAAEAEIKYRQMVRSGDPHAETYRNISNAVLAYNELSTKMDNARKEYAELLKQFNGEDGEPPLQNKAIVDRMETLWDFITANTEKEAELAMAIEDANYKARLQHFEEFAKEYEEQSEATVQQMINQRTLKGGGVADYNTEYDAIVIELRNLKQRRQEIEKYYAETMEHYQGNAEQLELLEAEKQAAITQLEKEMGEKRVELAQAEADRKLAIQKTYISAYQSISSQLSSVLGEVMNMYDENSKEYLNLRYAQGVTDTISGTLSAYMSGIESGITPPGNVILAGALAASTFAMGVMQLANMKNGTLSNATATPVQIGSEYDTLSYAQNAEILSNIQDQRVIVVESDITNTQNRVQVAESAATF